MHVTLQIKSTENLLTKLLMINKFYNFYCINQWAVGKSFIKISVPYYYINSFIEQCTVDTSLLLLKKKTEHHQVVDIVIAVIMLYMDKFLTEKIEKIS